MIEQLLNDRSTTRAWTSQVPSVADINTILRCISKAPFKQNNVDIKVHVLGPDEAERKDRYCRESRGITDAVHIASRDAQTQLLAPYVFYLHTANQPSGSAEQGMSLGIVSQTIVLAAQGLGLDSAFCRCTPDCMREDFINTYYDNITPEQLGGEDMVVAVGYARRDVDSRDRRQIDSDVLMAVHDDPPRPAIEKWIDLSLTPELELPPLWDRAPKTPQGPTDAVDGKYRWIH